MSMTQLKEFEIKLFELEFERPIEVLINSLKLFDTHLHLSLEYWSDDVKNEEDPQLGRETVFKSLTQIVKRSDVVMVENRITESQNYRIDVSVSGYAEAVQIYFETAAEADNMFAELTKWWLS